MDSQSAPNDDVWSPLEVPQEKRVSSPEQSARNHQLASYLKRSSSIQNSTTSSMRGGGTRQRLLRKQKSETSVRGGGTRKKHAPPPSKQRAATMSPLTIGELDDGFREFAAPRFQIEPILE